MEIKNFELTNVGLFSNVELFLAPTERKKSNITVIVGNNGAGKTTLLRSLATSLSWFVARVRTDKGSGSPISEENIRNHEPMSMIKVDVFDYQSELEEFTEGLIYSWSVV